MDVVTRAQWAARPPKRPPTATVPTELFIHHSVGSGQTDKDGDGDRGDDYMRQMQAFHMDGRGWDDIGYNHAHDPDGGEFYEGRGWAIRPGAQCGHNTGTHALVVMGDYRRRAVTPALLDDLARFYHAAQTAGHLPRVPVQGHRHAPVTGDCTGTTCPGDNLAQALPALNARIDQLHDEGDDVTRAEALALLGLTEHEVATLKKVHAAFDAERADVANVQGRLVRYGKTNDFPTTSGGGTVPPDVLRKGDTVRLA